MPAPSSISLVSSTACLVRLQHGVHAPQHAHRQDDVGVLAALEEVAQDVVGNAPDEGDDLVVGGLVHRKLFREDSVG
jgi:hypothetical protein